MTRPKLVLALSLAALLGGCGGSGSRGTWPQANGDLSGTRAAVGSPITAGNVAELRPRWSFRLRAKPSFSGLFASTPVADADAIYFQDLRSDVFAVSRTTGSLLWTHRYNALNDGPNGLAVDRGRVYGATDATVFALASRNGRELWQRHLVNAREQFVDVAPVVWDGLLFTSTIGYAPFGRGTIYALDANTGRVRWRFDTIRDPWPHPLLTGGGGTWYPVSIDSNGRLYAGTANPTPWGGLPKYPNGAAFPGPVPYTDSLVVLDAHTGKLLWTDQVTAHDIRDQDFEATPILAKLGRLGLVFGAGKAGRVIAWDIATTRRRWTTLVGKHENDTGPLPSHRVTVCPGLLGGVETPMAYAGNRLFVPVVDLCGWGKATARQAVAGIRVETGTGQLVALDAKNGAIDWDRRLPSPALGCATVSNDVVFTATFAGVVYGFSTRDGKLLWHTTMRAGVNACPAVVDGLLVVGAGIPRAGGRTEVVAFGLPNR